MYGVFEYADDRDHDLEASSVVLARVYLGVGTNELNQPDCEISQENREPVDDVEKMAAALRFRGMDPSSLLVVIEPCGVHDEADWARRLPRVLRFLFGKELRTPNSAREADSSGAGATANKPLHEQAALCDAASGAGIG